MTDSESRNTDPGLLLTVYRSVGWARLAVAGHAIVINILRISEAAHSVALTAACLVMLVWSVLALFWYQRPRMRTWWLWCTDVTITVLIVVSSRWVLGPDLLSQSYLGVACYWMLAAPTALSVRYGRDVGTICGLGVGVMSFLGAPSSAARAWSDVLLMIAIPWFVGLIVSELNHVIVERNQSLATAAALNERERLNRIVHDGVLQVLAMVAREGSELGPRGQMLAVLARKQEDQLRTTLQDKHVDIDAGESLDAAKTDITTMLEKHQRPRVTVSVIAGQVLMESGRASELDAVITEVLSNVFKHAGVNARAWVLLETDQDNAIISVRDDGVGMTPERLQQAADAGRMGIKQSVLGRINALGGTATLDSAPGKGTEWEFRVPVE